MTGCPLCATLPPGAHVDHCTADPFAVHNAGPERATDLAFTALERAIGDAK